MKTKFIKFFKEMFFLNLKEDKKNSIRKIFKTFKLTKSLPYYGNKKKL